jgi:hypothetical protein
MSSICKELGISTTVVHSWINSNEEFSKNYARAKEWQADFLAEEILEIADDSSEDVVTIFVDGRKKEVENKEFVNRSRLRVDARKWIASKLKPKKYGDVIKAELSGPEGAPIVLNFTEKERDTRNETDTSV